MSKAKTNPKVKAKTNPKVKAKTKPKAKAKARVKTEKVRVTAKTKSETFVGSLPVTEKKAIKKLATSQKQYDSFNEKVVRKQIQINAYQKDVDHWEAHKKTATFSTSTAQRKAAVEKRITDAKKKVEKYKDELIKLEMKRTNARFKIVNFFTPDRFDAFTKHVNSGDEVKPISYRTIKSDRVIKRGKVIRGMVTLHADLNTNSGGEYNKGSSFFVRVNTDGEHKTSELIEAYMLDAMRDKKTNVENLYTVEYIYTEERKPSKTVKRKKVKKG